MCHCSCRALPLRPDSIPGFFPEAVTAGLGRFEMEWILYAIHDNIDMVFSLFFCYVMPPSFPLDMVL